MNELTVRKRLLIAQADLHRHCLTLECQRVAEIIIPSDRGMPREPWWLSAVSTVGSLVLPAKWQGLLGALRLAPGLLRLFRP